MPETFWTVRWPDGKEERLYSPSSVVAELFQPGTTYPVADFLTRARIAMERASNRVKAVHGHACSLAMGQLDAVERRVATLAPDASVTCLKISQ